MPRLSVVISSLNGAAGVERCLRALAGQTIAASLETILVDDGSTDGTSEVGRALGATVIRHETNQGLSCARNSGIVAATAPVVAFLDDDCEPDGSWAAALLSAYEDSVTGVGGPVVPATIPGLVADYLERRNPLAPPELELSRSDALPYRFWLYLKWQWRTQPQEGRRAVYSLVGANMSFRRDALVAVGMFDPRFSFGADELDLCRRLHHAFPSGRLIVVPEARVTHYFEPQLRDTLRRSRAYGRGSARMYRKWPSANPTFFPLPVAVAGLIAAGLLDPRAWVVAALAPLVAFPRGVADAVRVSQPRYLLDAYLQLAQEVWEDLGFVEGLWRFRDLEPVDERTLAPVLDGAEEATVT